MNLSSLSYRLLLGVSVLFTSVILAVQGGHPGIVDDEIWHHVLKVLTKGYGGSKIILGHPEPAYLVDSYTKVYQHEPYYPHHHSHYHQPYHYAPPVYKAPVTSYGPPAHFDNHLGYYK